MKGSKLLTFCRCPKSWGKPTWAHSINYLFWYTELYPISLTKLMQLQKVDTNLFLFLKHDENYNLHFYTYFSIHWLELLDEAYTIRVKDGCPWQVKNATHLTIA